MPSATGGVKKSVDLASPNASLASLSTRDSPSGCGHSSDAVSYSVKSFYSSRAGGGGENSSTSSSSSSGVRHSSESLSRRSFQSCTEQQCDSSTPTNKQLFPLKKCSSAASRKQAAPPPNPNLYLKVRYTHYENAAVFVALANLLVDPPNTATNNNTPTTHVADERPYNVFSTHLSSSSDRTSQSAGTRTESLTQRIGYGMRCKYPCYVLALLYLGQIKKKYPHKLSITADTFQRLVAGAIVVAAKFYDDLYYSNEHYAKELGFPLESLNGMEICFLVLLEFNLRVNQVEFQSAQKAFDSVRLECCRREKTNAWCGLGTSKWLLREPVLSLAALSGAITVDALETNTANRLKAYMVSRETSQGYRYESEEEHLLKADIYIRCRTLHRLTQQCQEECRKTKRGDNFSLAAPAAAGKHC